KPGRPLPHGLSAGRQGSDAGGDRRPPPPLPPYPAACFARDRQRRSVAPPGTALPGLPIQKTLRRHRLMEGLAVSKKAEKSADIQKLLDQMKTMQDELDRLK